ncbi:MAG TPA: tRNA (adenosine(37)-N6)-threonylcarbamoyltransferase complex transferase subunit TsaD [Candidatus Portnoybacteria bacterium]|nr:tRNA (adenosine(37)-N6)-threonylcarbamoyltransferase complex transferase subunit TsaD [Candidatus Portnoybacteria bacterium]
MKILAIETSCDDTGIAILEYDKSSQPKILADFVSSQIKVHAKWGGVVPMLAKREHQKNIIPLFKKALKNIPAKAQKPGTKKQQNSIDTLKNILDHEPELFKKLLPFLKKSLRPDIDYISFTTGPGLEPALWVGVNFARALSYWWNIPLLPINHIEGHLCANFASGEISASQKVFPAIALIVSGGHTQLILIKKLGDYEIIGETRDDAAGEAFDKVAKMLKLGYPGGPIISKLARFAESRQTAQTLNCSTTQSLPPFSLPRPMLNSGDFDFSFSGLKTAVLYSLQKMTPAQIKKLTPMIAAEFQQSVIDVLTAKTLSAAKKHNAQTLILAGGVAANQALRESLSQKTEEQQLAFMVPPLNLCMDNAAMIALAAYWQLKQDRSQKADWASAKAQANLRIS